MKAELHELSQVEKVYAVIGGKGGVGKSSLTSMLAVSMQRKGIASAILDADLTGPSIPNMFGLNEYADGTSEGIFPLLTKSGIQIMSMNSLLENPTEPIVWRGAVLSEYVKSFWSRVIWSGVQCMFIDMPPGTGDIPITGLSELPVDGVVVVCTPQELATDVCEKAIKMVKGLNLPILGLLENQSSFICPNCKKEHFIYGESRADYISRKYDIPVVGKIPIDKDIAVQTDRGLVELYENDSIDKFSDDLEKVW